MQCREVLQHRVGIEVPHGIAYTNVTVMNGFIRVAHRGSSGTCPEDPRAANEKAVESGVDMVEIDCQLSKDGHVVVFHDERLPAPAAAEGPRPPKTPKQLPKPAL